MSKTLKKKKKKKKSNSVITSRKGLNILYHYKQVLLQLRSIMLW